MQAVCDHKYIFVRLTTAGPDGFMMLEFSPTREYFALGGNGILFPHWDKKVQFQGLEISMPFVLLGDPAYPLKPWLLQPFSSRACLQHDFNDRLRRARMTTENLFGRLTGRWK